MSEYTSKQSTVTVREEYNVHADADLKPTIREPVQMVKSRVVVLHGWVHTEPARRRLPGFDCCEAETGYVANVLRSNFFYRLWCVSTPIPESFIFTLPGSSLGHCNQGKCAIRSTPYYCALYIYWAPIGGYFHGRTWTRHLHQTLRCYIVHLTIYLTSLLCENIHFMCEVHMTVYFHVVFHICLSNANIWQHFCIRLINLIATDQTPKLNLPILSCTHNLELLIDIYRSTQALDLRQI